MKKKEFLKMKKKEFLKNEENMFKNEHLLSFRMIGENVGFF